MKIFFGKSSDDVGLGKVCDGLKWQVAFPVSMISWIEMKQSVCLSFFFLWWNGSVSGGPRNPKRRMRGCGSGSEGEAHTEQSGRWRSW